MTCDKCNDEGAYVVNETESHGEWRSASSSTVPCSCRAHLPAREGTAAWWSSEKVLGIDVTIPIFNESVSIAVDAEVPMDSENFRVLRRGNRYYPTLITVEGQEKLTLHGDTARNLARALIQAADAADAIDNADVDPCGHWAPCECKERAK